MCVSERWREGGRQAGFHLRQAADADERGVDDGAGKSVAVLEVLVQLRSTRPGPALTNYRNLLCNLDRVSVIFVLVGPGLDLLNDCYNPAGPEFWYVTVWVGPGPGDRAF